MDENSMVPCPQLEQVQLLSEHQRLVLFYATINDATTEDFFFLPQARDVDNLRGRPDTRFTNMMDETRHQDRSI